MLFCSHVFVAMRLCSAGKKDSLVVVEYLCSTLRKIIWCGDVSMDTY